MSENDALKALEEYRSQVEDTEEYIERFDILETVTNVGNDEVFTPRKVCTQMLDALPKEVWSNPNYRWLNPSTKNGVFEREIALRLNEGLKDAIPDEETRKKHILQDMIYSIGLTKFTSLVARRTLYYCCHANRKDDGLKDIGDHHSLNGHAIGNGTWFPDEEGNIKTPHAEHSFKKSRENWKCEFCGLSKENSYNSPGQIEHYAYEFIHHPAALLPDYLSHLFFGGNKDMKFDIIIGNPPYQLNDGGSKASASPIYQKFVQRAMELRPKYLAMIIPSRWMQAGKGLDDFRALMKSSHQFRVFHDFFSSKQCFPSSIAIEGGVCYFVWDRDYEGKCECVWHGVKGREERDFCYLGEDDCDIVLRGPLDRSIRRKVETVSLRLKSEGLIDESSFSKLISSTKPYGFRTDFIKNPEKYGLKPALSSPVDRGYRILGFAKKQIVGFLPPDYVFPENMRERERVSLSSRYFSDLRMAGWHLKSSCLRMSSPNLH